jgi:N-acetylglucosaminyldiphosphoundecaprenol N-acetyl-beta-D-mannosaminyltransferase
VCSNPEKVFAIRANPSLRPFFTTAGMVIPDGIGVVLALRVLYGMRLRRLPGADLMQEICAIAPSKGYRIFVFGSSEQVNREAIEILRMRHPGICIVGGQHGYISASDVDRLTDKLNMLAPDILFVALGSPGQERWIQQNLPRLNVKVVQGIGGTLDTITGRVRRAPRWMQAIGLEWLYRLLKQPSRFYRQLNLVRFAGEILRAKLSGEPA